MEQERSESHINPLTLATNFDGEQVEFDQPIHVTELIVPLLPTDEQAAWELLSLMGLAAAYGNNEPEYSATLIKEANPEYVEK